MQNYTYRLWVALILVSVLITSMPIPSSAHPSLALRSIDTQSANLSIASDENGVVFQWDVNQDRVNAADATSVAEAIASTLPQQRLGGYMLPVELKTVILSDAGELSAADAMAENKVDRLIEVSQITSLSYNVPLTIAPPLVPSAVGWEDAIEIREEVRQLPSSPFFILRQGRVRGRDLAVVAFSPIYEENGEVKITSAIQARLTNAQILDGHISQLMSQPVQRTTSAANLNGPTNAPLAFMPTNPAVFQSAVKIHVTEPGIQLVTGVDLINNGVPENIPLTNLKIAHRGAEIAVEIWDNGNGILDSSDTVRFFADHVEHSAKLGDYWNDEEIFWLTFSGSGGLRMANRNVVPGSGSTATVRSTAMEHGIWEDNLVRQSTMPGVDGDNWFHKTLNVKPSQLGMPSTYPTVTIPLNNKLPLATSSGQVSQFSITGSAQTVANHTLRASWGTTSKDVNWTNYRPYESWTHVVSSTVNHPQTIQFTLIPGELDSKIHFDKIYWEQPVTLDFGNRGAMFYGIQGKWRYQLTNVTSDAALYDITDAARPIRLAIPAGAAPQFEDGPDPHRYMLTTATDLQFPALSRHNPVAWPTQTQMHGLYIAYSQFHDELQPLIDLRRAQGYLVDVIDLQSIYDSWSFGLVSPDAIRNMLQYAVNNWDLAPVSAVAVGDTTEDPKNYRGNQSGNQNRNIFPTFLENTDPWLGETTCEPCFVQLDDVHPLDGTTDEDFLIDMWFGRFSIQDEAQLIDVVNKIVQYETATDLGMDVTWRQTSVYIADNYIRYDCSVDAAGDFATGAERIIADVQDPYMISTRIFYDPTSRFPECATSHGYTYSSVAKAGYYPMSLDVQDAALSAHQAGAGLITFEGHSNHFFSGAIEESNEFIFDFRDISDLQNISRLPILLQMTCLTGQFTYVSRTGTTMDERFQRHPAGGAVAVISPSGLTVSTGHHFLQEGFHHYLNNTPRYESRLGALMEAAYFNLFNEGTCCQDGRYTFLLLGDPLTRALVQAPRPMYLPLAQR
ncbi:MAG: C25 family cysteine peptidase [Chloroflexota bacterium]